MLTVLKGMFPKALLLGTLVMIILNLSNHFAIQKKDSEIALLIQQQKESDAQTKRLRDSLDILEKGMQESNHSHERLSGKLNKLQGNVNKYTEDIKKVDNAEVQTLLNTRLPDDLRRVLDKSISAEE